MTNHTLMTWLDTDLDTLRAQSLLVGSEGPDIGWYILAAPDGRWIAWDDSHPAAPPYTVFDLREEALDYQHAGYRNAYPDQFREVTWVPVNHITTYRIEPAAIRWRIRQGKWPLGHVRWRAAPGTGIYARWEVTRQSLD